MDSGEMGRNFSEILSLELHVYNNKQILFLFLLLFLLLSLVFEG